MEDILQVGIISSTHGLQGEVKVFPTTNDAKRFRKLKEVLLDTGTEEGHSGEEGRSMEEGHSGEKIILEIEGVKFFKQFVILKFKGLNHINDVEKYRQKSLYVTRENAVRLSKDEYFIADLVGLKVLDEEDQEIGVLKNVLETGANDVYEIVLSDGRELLLPAIKQCVLQVEVEEGWMKIHILDGLLE